MENKGENNVDPKSYPQTFNFLSEVYEVIKCFDKIDKNPSKLNNKINELKNKFEKAKQVLNNVNGIQMSYIEQQEHYNSLLKQYELKIKLLDSYKSACKFDTSEVENLNAFKNDSNTNVKHPLAESGEEQNNDPNIINDNNNENRFETSDIKSEDMDMDFMANI